MAWISRNAGGSIAVVVGFKSAKSDVRGRRNVLRVHHFVVSILFTNLFLVFPVWISGHVPPDPPPQVAIIISADARAAAGIMLTVSK